MADAANAQATAHAPDSAEPAAAPLPPPDSPIEVLQMPPSSSERTQPRQPQPPVAQRPAATVSGAGQWQAAASPAASAAVEPCVNCGQPVARGGGPPVGAGQSGWGGLVYAIGRFDPRFASLGAERQFADMADVPQAGLLPTWRLREVLSEKENTFLARQICWVFATQAGEAFTVSPQYESDIGRMLGTLPRNDKDETLTVVAGRPAFTVTSDPSCVQPGLPVVVADENLSAAARQVRGADSETGRGRLSHSS